VSARKARWDLLVLGGGTAGLVGAKTAARLGARVALVERDRTGGDCLWTECVPSKSLLAAAGHAAHARAGSALGVHTSDVRVDFSAVMQHVKAAIARIEPVDSVASLEQAGVHTIHGQARFTGPRTIEVDGVAHTFHQALLATGAAPAVPGIPGLADAVPLTSETGRTCGRSPDD
jgi:pyruvate/2-oxoglutarate dehydrogenase complex dihydrolipoamide dehydrogenase (E3) component